MRLASLPLLVAVAFGHLFAWTEGAAAPYGLDTRQAMGAFLNGAMPPATPGAAGLEAVVAFPNVDFEDPVALVAETNSTRLYVCERQGRIYFFTNLPSVNVKTLFLDVSAVTQ